MRLDRLRPADAGLPWSPDPLDWADVGGRLLLARHFEQPLANTAVAVRTFLELITRGARPTLDEAEQIAEGVRLMQGALAEEADGAIQSTSIAAGCSTFDRFATICGRPADLAAIDRAGVLSDFIHAVALFANELDTAYRRAAIAARGDLPAKFATISAALTEPAPDRGALQ